MFKTLAFFICASSLAASAQQRELPVLFWSHLEPEARVRVEPHCPVGRLKPGESGSAMVRIVVGTDGKVKSATPPDAENRLNDAAVKAISKWEFRPQIVAGKVTEVQSMAMLEVCEEAGDTPVIVIQSRLSEAMQLIEKCSTEETCARASAFVEQMQGQEAVIARGMLDVAYGDIKAQKRDFQGAEIVYKRSLPLLRKEEQCAGLRNDLLYRLGLLYDSEHRYEQSLQVYEEQEEALKVLQKLADESEIPHTAADKAETRHGLFEMMKESLEGQLRSLVALNRTADAEAVKDKLAKLRE